ncbi:hypothetical protein GQ42DRAFT_66721 [Ramicandelaber brevisporus]|nr:hypothetical protein GQ42DRAFT_66721 [Ramicandelaber brevisporus]
MSQQKVDEEAVIKHRLLLDDRRLRSCLAKYASWSSKTSTSSPSELLRLEAATSSALSETTFYDNESDQIRNEVAQTTTGIDDLRQRLKESLQTRENRIMYDSIAREIEKHSKRDECQQEIALLQQEISHLERKLTAGYPYCINELLNKQQLMMDGITQMKEMMAKAMNGELIEEGATTITATTTTATTVDTDNHDVETTDALNEELEHDIISSTNRSAIDDTDDDHDNANDIVVSDDGEVIDDDDNDDGEDDEDDEPGAVREDYASPSPVPGTAGSNDDIQSHFTRKRGRMNGSDPDNNNNNMSEASPSKRHQTM